MSSLSEDLSQLHRLLLELEEVEEMQRSGPRKVAVQEKIANQKLEECGQQKTLITEMRKATDGKSLQLKTTEAKIEDHKARLNAAASNREYGIIKSQIEANTMANSVLEDEILEALEKIDTTASELVELQKQHTELVERQKKTAGEVAAAADGLTQRATALTEKIREAAKCVPASAADQFQRLRGAHGASALAGVENSACDTCYSELSPQNRVALNLGKVLFCDSCGRLLYRIGKGGGE